MAKISSRDLSNVCGGQRQAAPAPPTLWERIKMRNPLGGDYIPPGEWSRGPYKGLAYREHPELWHFVWRGKTW
jgi:hypothetical protein